VTLKSEDGKLCKTLWKW